MIKKSIGETWKQIQFAGHKELKRKYAVSSLGRAASYLKDVEKDGKMLEGSNTSGYRTLNLHVGGSNGTIYIHREVARLFCRRPSTRHKFVVHINHKKSDNQLKNLKWSTLEEVSSHQQNSPAKIAYKKKQATRLVGMKLSAAQVKSIKQAIHNPKRTQTLKQIAEKYKISEMSLYRIKSGESWGHVK